MNIGVKFLEVVFENCESIVIPIERIKELTYSDLKFLPNPFKEKNYFKTDNLILKISYSDKLELNYDNNKYDQPIGMFTNNPLSNNIIDRPDILGRTLQHNDIVCVDLLDENKYRLKYIHVPWCEDNEYSNSYMDIEVEENLLVIVFSREKIKKEDERNEDS